MTQSSSHAALSAALQQAGFTQDAAEYHGALCGALCTRPPQAVNPMTVLDGAEGGESAALLALRDAMAQALADSDGDVQLVLPDDETQLAVRAQALGEWCEGFLFGLASDGRLNLKTVSPEVREVIEDFTQFTKAAFNEGDNAEIEEEAYAQLVEYVRVGLQMIFMELSPRPITPKDPTLH